MIVACSHCQTRFSLNDQQQSALPFKAKCSHCQQIFEVEAIAEDAHQLADEQILLPKHKVFVICNQKGGVAKTTTVMNLGFSLALQQQKVLLIDFDIQGNLSELMQVSGRESFYDVLESKDPQIFSKSILSVGDNIWVLPANDKLAVLPKRYLNTKGFEYLLSRRIAQIKGFFDYILIDTPPSMDFFTINGLIAADVALIPTQAELLATKGVAHVQKLVKLLNEKSQTNIDFRILLTMIDAENTVNQVVEKSLQEQFPGHLLSTRIERDIKLQESQITLTAVSDYAPDSKAAVQYAELAQEVLQL